MKRFALPQLKLPVLSKSAGTVVWLSVIISLAIIIVLTIVPRKPPLVVFDLVTEHLSQEVSQPALSAFAVTGARIPDHEGCDASFFPDERFTGIVQPMAGSRVVYNWRPDGIGILIDRHGTAGGARLTMDGTGSECELSGETIGVALPGERAGTQLPLAGPAEIGIALGMTTTTAASGLLRGGQFQVFGRSIAPWAADVLYPITANPISVPTGSRLNVPGQGDALLPMIGVVIYTADGFTVSATANGSQVNLFRPGLMTQNERFSFGAVSDFFTDPQVGLIFFGVFVLVTVLQLVTGWVGLWRDRSPSDA